MSRPSLLVRRALVLAATVAAALTVPGLAHAIAPVITSVEVDGQQLYVTWSLDDNEDSDYIEVGTQSSTDSSGSFLNVAAYDDLSPGDIDWTSPTLGAGTYYVHVRGTNDDGDDEWSTISTITIAGTPNQPSGPVPPSPSPPSQPPGTPVPPPGGASPPSGGQGSSTTQWSWAVEATGANLSVGLYLAPAKPVYQSLIDTFGAPDQCEGPPGRVLAVWKLIGLAARLSGAEPSACADPSGSIVRTITLTGMDWVTPAGVHVGDSATLFYFLYPSARRLRRGPDAGAWRFAGAGGTTPRRGDVLARTSHGYVDSFVLVLSP